jgi:maltose/maltodextrin transport system substrate-binding protein
MKQLTIILALMLIRSAVSAQTTQALRDRASADTLKPIRPGIPGKSPFWNGAARQFIWVPSFDFKSIDGASSYIFTIRTSTGGMLDFESPEPTATLARVWSRLPVGTTTVEVEAINKNGDDLGTAGERTFHRAATFRGPYGSPVVPYDQSAQIALASAMKEPFVQAWRTTGKPDPSYPLYRYASKIIGALVSGCAMHASESPRPADADQSIKIARAAADYLISISGKAGTRLEYFPPTYHNAAPTARENDNWTMLISPAEACQGYLDLYDVTHDDKYLDAAQRIARTYAKLQLPSGTWHLKVDNRTNEPLAPIDLIPSVVIQFLDRMVTQYHFTEAQPALDKAVKWMMDNPVKTFDWKAQFDDAKLRGPYENLSKHEACLFAGYLFQHNQIDLAKEILDFAEDQFVVWEQPPASSAKFQPLENWFIPCSCEQYAMFEPISGSSGFMIVAYVHAYDATKDPLYLAKAQSLANALTVAQSHYEGRYPTRMYKTKDRTYWINSTVNTARAMQMLGDTEARLPVQWH